MHIWRWRVFYYWGYRDYDAGLRELDRVIELQPSSSNSRSYYGLRSTAAAVNGNARLLNSSARRNSIRAILGSPPRSA